MFFVCQAGFQDLLIAELAESGFTSTENGPGWAVAAPATPLLAEGAAPTPASAGESALPPDLAFPHWVLTAPIEVKGDSVNALAQRLADGFFNSLRGERIETPWPCVFHCPAEIVGLGRRVASVEKAFAEIVKKRFSRVAKLAVSDFPRGVVETRGWAVYFTDFGRAFASRGLFVNGQRRMADDERAPSRSYLKIEEAFVILGREPQPGELVADLGAAPGGWSFSAAKRGARVIAIDNGPLKGGAYEHPQIDHRREDAFHFKPEPGQRLDWLFCDMVEDPHHVLSQIVEPWLSQGWCRTFVINFKFGHVAPEPFLAELRANTGVFARYAPGFRVRHLYHDREEFTVVGEITLP